MHSKDITGTASLSAVVDLRSALNAERIAGRYEVREKLGSGGMSTVYLAHDHKNGTDVAIKFMKTDLGGSARRRFFREFNTIAGIHHPCCLQVFEIGETRDAPYFTMELHPGRPSTSILGEAPKVVAPMLVDLSLAVDYIHSQGIVHRDIKPSNVMVLRTGDQHDGRLNCKLADFGLAKFYQLDSSLTAERGIVGTPAYCAPEQIDGGEIDHRADLYAIGILAFELLSGGRHPFASERSQGVHALLHAQLRKTAPRLSDINPNLSSALSDVVGSYLAKEPDLRPSHYGGFCAKSSVSMSNRGWRNLALQQRFSLMRSASSAANPNWPRSMCFFTNAARRVPPVRISRPNRRSRRHHRCCCSSVNQGRARRALCRKRYGVPSVSTTKSSKAAILMEVLPRFNPSSRSCGRS